MVDKEEFKTPIVAQLSLTSEPRQMFKNGLKNSSWGVFGSPKAPVAWERAPGAYLGVGACCVGFKWHFSVEMARWSTPRVPFRGTRGVFWGAREVTRKPKRTVLKPRTRTWALRVPRIHLPAASHAKHSPLFSPEKGHFLAFTPGPLTEIFGR